MQPFEQGDWVTHADYAALQAENERLKDGIHTIEYHADGVYRFVSAMEYDRVKAENERLRKAGDAMASQLTEEFIGRLLIKDWEQAKGVQS